MISFVRLVELYLIILYRYLVTRGSPSSQSVPPCSRDHWAAMECWQSCSATGKITPVKPDKVRVLPKHKHCCPFDKLLPGQEARVTRGVHFFLSFIVKRSETIKDSYGSGRRFNKIVIRRNSFSTNNNKKTSLALFTLCVFAFFAKKTWMSHRRSGAGRWSGA